MADDILERARRALAGITRDLTYFRYDHGGGRAAAMDDPVVRRLVLDCYSKADREFYFSAPGLVRDLMAEVELRGQCLDGMRAEIETLRAEVERLRARLKPITYAATSGTWPLPPEPR